MYNKNNLRVAVAAASNSLKPELGAVLFTGKVTVATDAFRLLEVSVPEGEALKHAPVLINAKALQAFKLTDKQVVGIETLEQLPTVSNATFPHYEPIFPTEKPLATVQINARFMAEICDVMRRLDKFSAVTLSLFGDNKPVVIEAKGKQKARAMIMPMMKSL